MYDEDGLQGNRENDDHIIHNENVLQKKIILSHMVMTIAPGATRVIRIRNTVAQSSTSNDQVSLLNSCGYKSKARVTATPHNNLEEMDGVAAAPACVCVRERSCECIVVCISIRGNNQTRVDT